MCPRRGCSSAAFGLPRWILSTAQAADQAHSSTSCPNAIDVIVRGIRSGLPLGDCMRIIATRPRIR